MANIHTFGATILSSSRGPQDIGEIMDALDRLNIQILFLIGGDGTLRAAHLICEEVSRRELRIAVIVIPKTIDNDIPFVSRSFGFDTAVEIATEAIHAAHTEALGAPNGIGLVKLMGRHSGFIAANAALALRDVNFVLIPESYFDIEGDYGLLGRLEARLKSRGHAVIMVAEGAGQHYFKVEDLEPGSHATQVRVPSKRGMSMVSPNLRCPCFKHGDKRRGRGPEPRSGNGRAS